ncbi:UDP-N-acetylmuramate dehydrogenase [Fusibacter sp. JL216-2]|uniref:UDP-N-acetylmuramate dehydrogenase n=1 Tax=Fusibacter sp. JL216-2 TaxID=3071453 RepID=UPI003D328364
MIKSTADALLKSLRPEIVYIDEPMNKHTSFKIGGPADVLVMPQTVEDVKCVLDICKEHACPCHIVGNGSNLLVGDDGIRGVVLKLSENFSGVEIEGDKVKAKSGILLSQLSNRVVEKSLGGFEFASGIPGTLGGAVFMNAGAYGGEMKDVVREVTVLTQSGEVKTLSNEELDFGYRRSAIQREKHIVLEVSMELTEKPYDDIKNIIDDLTHKRTTKQPLSLPSAGSTFKRPEGYYAGKLIDDAGLRGIRYGDAQVSELHCGFIVNRGKATSEDVLTLISLVQKVVYDKFGVELEPEVRLFGKE